MVTPGPLKLGSGFSFRFFSWTPDREIAANAERYAGVPDVERAGGILTCPHGEGGVTFDRPGFDVVFGSRPRWTVVSEDPLTLTPSIDCGDCVCHGYITDGVWVSV